MKICQLVATSRELGGLEKHVVDLSAELAKRHEVHLIGDPLIETMVYGKTKFHPLPMRSSRRNPLMRWRLSRILKQLAPDIVHAQANKAAAFIGHLRLAPDTAKVATIHNSKRDTKAFRQMDRVIAVSPTAAVGIQGVAVDVIHNGIRLSDRIDALDPNQISALPLRRCSNLPLLLAVGRLVEAKGFDILIPAMKSVDAELWIAGDGPDQRKLEALITHEGLQNRVSLLGRRSDVSELTFHADLAVISSRNEGFPYTLVEYLHRRIPVVSTAISGVDQFLPASYLLPDLQSKGLADLISDALSKLDDLPEIFESAFQFATNELTLARMAERTEEVYQRVLSAKQSS